MADANSENVPASDLPKCSSCGEEITPLPRSGSEEVVVNISGMVGIVDTGQLYMGQICESCHKFFCAMCCVHIFTKTGEMDKCDQCGGHLVPLTSLNLP